MTGRIAGLCGIAIGVAVLRHAFPKLFAGAGVVGVVMFFAVRPSHHRSARHRAPPHRPGRPPSALPAAGPLGDRGQLTKTAPVALSWAGNLPMWLAALAGVAVLSVIPLRGHALTHLAGGPAIATLTAVLLLSWRTRNGPLAAALTLLTLLVAGVSWRLVEKPLSCRPSAVAV